MIEIITICILFLALYVTNIMWALEYGRMNDEWAKLCEEQRKDYADLFEQAEKDWQERIKAIMKERENNDKTDH